MRPELYPRFAWTLVAITAVSATADTVVTASYQPLLGARSIADHGWPLLTYGTVAAAVMGALIISRYPRHPIGWLLILGGIATSLSLVLESYGIWVISHDGPGSESAGYLANWMSALLGASLGLTTLTLIFLIAPDGHLASPRWRYAAWAGLTGVALFTAGILTVPPRSITVDSSAPPDFNLFAKVSTFVGVITVGAALVAATVSLVRRLRRAQGETRQQLRWIAFAATALAVGLVILLASEMLGVNSETAPNAVPLYAAYFAFPICVAVAVLRYRLFDLDLVINRAVVLTIATVTVAMGYVVLVVVIGGNAGGFWPSLLATVVVALAFQPLRSWVVRLADRLAYGTRAAPYEALADFSRRLGEGPDPAALLPAIAEAAAGAVSAERAWVRLTVDQDHQLMASWPSGQPEPAVAPEHHFPVADHGDELGELQVWMPAGRTLREHDRRLLVNLADQAAIAFRNIRLETELQLRVQELAQSTAALDESRWRLIEARDRERSRIERAIARDVMPHLEPMPDQLARLAGTPEGPIEAPLDALVRDTTTALEALREITRGVFPAQLTRGGLGPALTSHLSRFPGLGRVLVAESAGGQRFDPGIEAAAYFCVAEAVRELGPPVEVALSASDDQLVITVSGPVTHGLPIANLRDRIEAIGGWIDETVVDDRSVIEVVLRVLQPVPAGAES